MVLGLLADTPCRPCRTAAALEAASSGSEAAGRFWGSMRLGRGMSPNQACVGGYRTRSKGKVELGGAQAEGCCQLLSRHQATAHSSNLALCRPLNQCSRLTCGRVFLQLPTQATPVTGNPANPSKCSQPLHSP